MSPDVAHIRCSAPEAVEAEVMLRLNQFGGMITSVEREADSRTVLEPVSVPQFHESTLPISRFGFIATATDWDCFQKISHEDVA
jgi:hypothetical protein